MYCKTFDINKIKKTSYILQTVVEILTAVIFFFYLKLNCNLQCKM